jgi:glyoxylase-like metal-dependent hydrolase (beta-lactamase superfamily II)
MGFEAVLVLSTILLRKEGIRMEIRLNANAKDPLATKVFYSDEEGFEVASVIVMGKTDAVLLDAQWTLSNAHRVISEILETGKVLKTIYISHAHPDHYFGLGTIAHAFPEARIIAIPSEADLINRQFFGKIKHWEGIIGPINLCRKKARIEPLKSNYFELEGHRLEIKSKVMGDMKYNTMVWIPLIKTLYASDVLFNQSHPFTCELKPKERKQWIRDIDRIEKMRAKVIIPGHQKPGMPFDESSLDFTREYILATDEELARTTNREAFFYNMADRFPEAHLIRLSNEMNANVFKNGRSWKWR